MCFNTNRQTIADRSTDSGLNSVSIQATIKPGSTPGFGVYGTGKGTTARIVEFLDGKFMGRSAREIGDELGLPSRQLSKRLAEQVKKGVIYIVDDESKIKSYALTSQA